MKTITLFSEYIENNESSFIISSLTGTEVRSENIELVLKLLQNSTYFLEKENEKLKSENKDLEVKNRNLFFENYDLKSQIARLNFEIEKLELKVSQHENNYNYPGDRKTVQKGLVNDSDLTSGGNLKIGDDVISGNRTVNITHNHYSNQPSDPKGDKNP